MALRRYHQRQVRTWVLWAGFAYVCLRGIAGTLAGDLERVDELAEQVPYYSDAKGLVEWAIGDIGAGGVALLLMAYPMRFVMASAARMCGAGGFTFERVSVWVGLIGQCADIVRSSGTRDHHLSSVSLRLPVMRVRGARIARGTVPIFSRRNGPLKAHAAEVVEALRGAEAALDKESQNAARDLGRLALTISERYALGQLGALLDEGDLKPPRRMGDALRLSITAVLVAVIVIASARHGVPEPAAIAAAVVVVAILYQSATAGGIAGVGLVVIEILLNACSQAESSFSIGSGASPAGSGAHVDSQSCDRLPGQRLGDLPELTATGRLHEHGVTRTEDGFEVGGSGGVVAYQRNVRHPRRAGGQSELLGEVSADGHDEIDAALGREAADLAVGFHSLVAQLEHLSEYGDPPAAWGLGGVAVSLGHQDSPSMVRGAKVIARPV